MILRLSHEPAQFGVFCMEESGRPSPVLIAEKPTLTFDALKDGKIRVT
jgi:hypothetical protein